MKFKLLYPQPRIVDGSVIMGWAKDAEADGDIEGGFGDDVFEAIRQLEDAGTITVSTEIVQ